MGFLADVGRSDLGAFVEGLKRDRVTEQNQAIQQKTFDSQQALGAEQLKSAQLKNQAAEQGNKKLSGMSPAWVSRFKDKDTAQFVWDNLTRSGFTNAENNDITQSQYKEGMGNLLGNEAFSSELASRGLALHEKDLNKLEEIREKLQSKIDSGNKNEKLIEDLKNINEKIGDKSIEVRHATKSLSAISEVFREQEKRDLVKATKIDKLNAQGVPIAADAPLGRVQAESERFKREQDIATAKEKENILQAGREDLIEKRGQETRKTAKSQSTQINKNALAVSALQKYIKKIDPGNPFASAPDLKTLQSTAKEILERSRVSPTLAAKVAERQSEIRTTKNLITELLGEKQENGTFEGGKLSNQAIGIVGSSRNALFKIAQSLFAIGDFASNENKFIANITKKNKELNEGESPLNLSNFRDPNISKGKFLLNMISYKLALLSNPDGRISDADFKNARKTIAGGGIVNTVEDLADRLSAFQDVLDIELETTGSVIQATKELQGAIPREDKVIDLGGRNLDDLSPQELEELLKGAM